MIAELPAPEKIDEDALAEALRDGSLDLVCVLGPTASGKTRYAVSLARRLGAEIISADSRQVYRGMDIGTGKDLSEYGDVPFHLIDIQPAGAKYNVYEYQKDFVKVYQDVRCCAAARACTSRPPPAATTSTGVTPRSTPPFSPTIPSISGRSWTARRATRALTRGWTPASRKASWTKSAAFWTPASPQRP